MLGGLTGWFDANRREVSRLFAAVEKVNALEEEVKKLPEEEFARRTAAFRDRLQKGETVHDLLPEAYALVREAARRTIGLRAYDVQLEAAIALAEGKIAEQKTGEGKTLSAVFPLYLHGLTGKGVHLVTVNDYLARRDAGWNGPVFDLLGMSVGVVYAGEGQQPAVLYDRGYEEKIHKDERLRHLRPVSRKEAYGADVTYGTNNEFGFDFLRDNMVMDAGQMVQRGHYFAIVDEVDSILIDEARTPLIISAPDTEPTRKYYEFSDLVKKLSQDTDYEVDEKLKTAVLTEHGLKKVEKLLGVSNLYEEDFEAIHMTENALRAATLFLRDRDYVVKEDKVIIVDEFTGRLMYGRRWSEGLHQAVEAKEGVAVQQESRTLATISFQNYFRMYEKLSGMTGTAATEAEEFAKIYELDVVVVPTNKPMVRKDAADVVYKTQRAKYGALVSDVEKRVKKGQPVLVGTTSIEKNEVIARLLEHKKVTHNVLNAKQHEREAEIIAEAGRPGAVTVATNMAGRGVDIVLGGSVPERPEGMSGEEFRKTEEYQGWQEQHDKVIKAGGLHVIGTERHESRRIDNQLRGRSGRQGDPGSSRFYLALDDDLMRIFGGERMAAIMDKLKVPENEPIENSLISKAIEQAQTKVEGFHFDQRKHLVEYDDVANKQREIIYGRRKKVLEADRLKEEMMEKMRAELAGLVGLYGGGDLEGRKLEVDYQKLLMGFMEILPLDEAGQRQLLVKLEAERETDKIEAGLVGEVERAYEAREKQVKGEVMGQMEKFAYLTSLDKLWMEHLDTLDDLREGVRLRAHGQRDPLVEYKNEAFDAFEALLSAIDAEMVRRLFRIQVGVRPQPVVDLEKVRTNVDTSDQQGLVQADVVNEVAQDPSDIAQAIATLGKGQGNGANRVGGGIRVTKLGRNEPCWCGSGKKFKKCHWPQLPAA